MPAPSLVDRQEPLRTPQTTTNCTPGYHEASPSLLIFRPGRMTGSILSGKLKLHNCQVFKISLGLFQMSPPMVKYPD